jgi:ABC-2 type transport system permease protein
MSEDRVNVVGARVRNTLTVLRYAAATGFADFGVMFTWRTWTLGWLSRVLCQVAFFAMIGRLLDSPDVVRYLLIGNAVLIAVVESAFVVASTTWERRAGTLPLLIAAPTSPVVVFCGRSVQWLASGTASASIALLVLAPVFGISLPMPQALLAVPLIGLVSVSAYCFGLVLAGVVLRAMELRNVVGNVIWMGIALLAGVQVPVTFWPGWAQAVSQVLPATTHGLAAIRDLLGSGPLGPVAVRALLELAVALGWLSVAALTFRHLAEQGRRNGAIEFAD